MKNLFLNLLFISSFLVSCNSADPKFDIEQFKEAKTTTIKGKIADYNPNEHNNFIRIGFNDLVDFQLSDEVQIDDSGRFQTSFSIFYPREFFIYYGNSVSLYAFPGDTLNVEMDIPFFTNEFNFAKSFDYISVTGGSHQMTQDHLLYKQYYWQKVFDTMSYQVIGEYDSKTYSAFIKERMRKEKVAANSFMQANNSSPFFKTWLNYQIDYNAYDDLLRYTWLHTVHAGINRSTYKVPEAYYSFLNNDLLEQKEAMICGYYSSFMREYARIVKVQNMDSLSKVQFEVHQQNKDELAAFAVIKNVIDKNTSGYTKEFVIAEFYQWLLEIKKIDVYESFVKERPIKDSVLSKYLVATYKSLRAKMDNEAFDKGVHLLSISSEIVDSLLIKLAQKHQGKLMYIDFWAPWCSPCVGEFPHSKTLEHKYKDEDIAFVYLCSGCEEKAWKATISEYQLKGDHYLLTSNQYSFLQNQFKITGIPRYLIADKNGNIVNDNAPRPSMQDELDKIFKDLL